MAKKTEVDIVKDRILQAKNKVAELTDEIEALNLLIRALGSYLWDIIDVPDGGEPPTSIDLGGNARIERKQVPKYDAEQFCKDCPEEIDDIRGKKAMKDLESYMPTGKEMEATYTVRKDGDALRAKHLVEMAKVYAVVLPPKE